MDRLLPRLDALIDRKRLFAYALILIGLYVAGFVAIGLTSPHLIDPYGKPVGYDFMAFYAGSDMILHGQIGQLWTQTDIVAREQALLPGNRSMLFWHYPPTFAFLVAPLALLPYLVSYLAWTILSALLYLAFVRSVVKDRLALIVALAAPAAFLNAVHGQNAFLSTACLGFGLLMIERRPWLAGVILGLLVNKPHFAVLLPLLLAVGGRWKTFLSTGATAAGLMVLSAAVFGVQPWLAFVHNLPVAPRVLEEGSVPWAQVPSLFVALRWLGVPQPLAYAGQAIMAALAVALAVIVWRGKAAHDLKAAMAVAATLMVTPYFFDYDLTLMAVPLAILARRGLEHGLQTGVKAAMGLAFLMPLVGLAVGIAFSVQLMPLGLLALLWACWTTARSAVATKLAGVLVPASSSF
jgi:alpha-1,2-mannosyltransferase